MEDREITRALKPKVLDLLGVLVVHGHITKREIIDSIGGPVETVRVETPNARATNLRELMAEFSAEKRTREFLEDEVTELQNGTTKLLKQWREAERREALSQRKLDELRGQTERLVEATRDGVASLQRLRGEMKKSDRGAAELADHVRRMRAIVEAVQALRVPQKTDALATRDGHEAR